jgi:hypothetical protein
MAMTLSISSIEVSSKGLGIAVPALFTSTSSRPNAETVRSTAGDGRGIAGIRLDRDRLATHLLDFLDHRRRGIGALGVGDRYIGAVGRQPSGDTCADAA